MKVTLKGKRASVSLTKRDFIAQGGEGAVYRKAGTAYKIYLKASSMIPEAKIEELSHISRPEVNKPEDIVLDEKGRAVGYTYRFIDNATALCQLFTKAFKERHGIGADRVGELVQNMQEVLHHIHEKGVLVVDLNELNLLVPDGWRQAYWIDVDSYQTRSFPATAIMDSIRDWHTAKFNELSDWFSFAVVSFQLFIGVHPYKGKHSLIKGMIERMRANVSVFDPSVKVPAMCPPLDVIPAELLGWYRRVLQDGRRELPPAIIQAVSGVIPRVRKISSTAKLSITEWRAYPHKVVRFLRLGNHDVALTMGGLQVGKTLHKSLPPSGAVGLTPKQGHVIYANHYCSQPQLYDATRARSLELDLHVDGCMDYDGRIYFKAGDRLYEVEYLELPHQIKPSVRPVANVMEHATKLYDGVAVHNLLGACYVSVFDKPGSHRELRIQEVEGAKILDGKYDHGLLVLVGEQGGKYHRWSFLLGDVGEYSCLGSVEVGSYLPPNFVVLPNRVCALINEDEELELSLVKLGAGQVRVVQDPVLSHDMRLCRSGMDVLFAQDTRVYKISTR
jgi:hypothetical protein